MSDPDLHFVATAGGESNAYAGHDAEITPLATNETQSGRWIQLVPVEVFGLLCEDHDDLPKAVGWGLCDAVQSWSDCNRAEGHIYRVEDLPGLTRLPGETARAWVADADLPFFEKRWGEIYSGVDPVERIVGMDPPTAPSPIAAAIAAAESRGYAKAIAKLRARAVDIAAYDDAYMHAADYLEASSPSTEEPNHG